MGIKKIIRIFRFTIGEEIGIAYSVFIHVAVYLIFKYMLSTKFVWCFISKSLS